MSKAPAATAPAAAGKVEPYIPASQSLPELTVGASAQALSQAARSYGGLEHPRIARMSEFGVAQGQTFTAVELVAGLDMFRLMQESKLAGVAIPPARSSTRCRTCTRLRRDSASS